VPDIGQLRKRIDQLDDKIIDCIAERFAIVEEVILYKRENDIPVRIQDRIRAVIDRNEATAITKDLPAGLIAELYKHIIEATCRHEEQSLGD
jgi:chorismate mutase